MRMLSHVLRCVAVPLRLKQVHTQDFGNGVTVTRGIEIFSLDLNESYPDNFNLQALWRGTLSLVTVPDLNNTYLNGR